MQKYILGASPDTQSAMIQPFDDSGRVTGNWRLFNAGIVYIASDVDARIAELEQMVRCSYACCCGDCARKIEKLIPDIEHTHGKGKGDAP